MLAMQNKWRVKKGVCGFGAAGGEDQGATAKVTNEGYVGAHIY